jgi:outer membrane protein assembly factor BamA
LARTGLSMTLNTPSNQRLRLRAGIHIEQRRLNEVEEGALLDDELWSQMLQGADNLASTASITDEALQGLLIYDARDHPLLPTRGLRLSFATEFHPGLSHALAKTQQVPRFLKGELKLRGHLPLGRLSLETQLSGGGALIAGDGVVPLEERYRLGGTGSFRGFIRDSLGPKNRVVKDSADGSENSHFVPTGGDTYALATLELLVPLSVLGMRAWEDYAVALFSDVGNTWLLRGSTTSTQGLSIDFDPLLRSSVGLGARMGTPIGPLRIDVASNLSALTASPTIRRFLKEEYNEKRLRLHLSLGTLF